MKNDGKSRRTGKSARVAPSGEDVYGEALQLATGEAPDWKRVKRLLERAASLGEAKAIYALATWYLFGNEPLVKKSVRTGNQMLREAAQKGNAEALYDLGVSYDLGKGVRENPRKAFEYYLASALRGDPQGAFDTALCFYHGDGVESDARIAKIFFARARELGSLDTERLPRKVKI